MKLTESLLRNLIKEALDISTTDYNTRPVIISRSAASKAGVDRDKSNEWLWALVGEQWKQISQDPGAIWRAEQAFKTAANAALYDLAKEYTERLEAGEYTEAKPMADTPEHPWHDPEEYENI